MLLSLWLCGESAWDWVRGRGGGTDFSSSAGEAPSLSVTCEGVRLVGSEGERDCGRGGWERGGYVV